MLNQKDKLKILYEESMDYARSYRDIKKTTEPSEEVGRSGKGFERRC